MAGQFTIVKHTNNNQYTLTAVAPERKNRMSKYIFLYRVTGEDDRDSCAYLENKPMRFECGHYFGRMILHGSCYCNSDWKDYSDIETILTEDEYDTLRKVDAEISKLGYGIKPEDERYQRGIALVEKVKVHQTWHGLHWSNDWFED